MATQVQTRRGNTSSHSTFTGAVGEITIDTDRKSIVVHDGSTVGGNPVPNWAAANATFIASAGASYLSNTSGTIYRGDLYFANGNVAIGQSATPPTELYVNGSSASVMNTLVDGATVTPIFGGVAGNNNFTVTLGGNRVIANPVQPTVGQSGVMYIVQDGTGSRTLGWGNTWKFQGNTAPTLSTSANSVDMLVYAVRTTANIACQLVTNIG